MTSEIATADSGSTVLLPSMVFGLPYSRQPDGKQVYISTNAKLLCPHGELSSTICYWIAAEKRARMLGLPPPQRGGSRSPSLCDCASTEGLNVKPCSGTPLPELPASLFEHLEVCDTELIQVKGRDARRIPHLGGPTFLTSTGKLVCRHGASRASLAKRAKMASPSARMPTCSCSLKPLPSRLGLKTMRLGKYCGKAVLSASPPAHSA